MQQNNLKHINDSVICCCVTSQPISELNHNTTNQNEGYPHVGPIPREQIYQVFGSYWSGLEQNI